jgi:hypothetical protein
LLLISITTLALIILDKFSIYKCNTSSL